MDGHGRKRLLGAAPGDGGSDRSNSLPRSSKAQRLVPMAMKTDEDILYRRIESGKERLPRDMWDLPRFDTRTPWYDCKTGGPTAVAQQREVRLWRTAANIVVKPLLSFLVENKKQAGERLQKVTPDNADVVVQSGAAAPTLKLGVGEDGGTKLYVRRHKYTTVYQATAILKQKGEGNEVVRVSAVGTSEQQAKDIASYGAMRLLRDSALVMGAPTVRDFTAALPTMLRLKDPHIDALLSQPPVGGWPAPLPPPQPIAPKAKAKAKPAAAVAAAKKPSAKQQQQPTHVERLLRVLEVNAANCRRAGVNYRTHRVAVPTLIKLRGDEVGTPPNMGVRDCTVSLERGVVAKGQRQLKDLFPGAKLRPAAPNDPRVREFGIYLEVNQGAVQEVVFEVGRVLRLFKAAVSANNSEARQQWRGVVAWATTASAALDEAAFELTKRLDDVAKLSCAPGVVEYARKRNQIKGLLATV